MRAGRWLQWLSTRDRGLAALRRAGRTAIIMPSLFALGDKVVANPTIATFAAFGSFAMLLLVDFGGPMRERLQAQAMLAVAGAVLVCLGTLASQKPWLAAVAMALVAFAILFAGVVSSVLTGAAPSLLLAFILPVATKAPVAQIPDRLAGWGLASGAALVAIAVLWPAPARDPLREQAATACRALATRLHADVVYRLGGANASMDAHLESVVQANASVAALHRTFLATPYRPTGLSTPARTVVRLVDELTWLDSVVIKASPHHLSAAVNHAALAVKSAAAVVLERGADLLDHPGGDIGALNLAVEDLRGALASMERNATTELPVHRAAAVSPDVRITEIVTSLDPSFRAQELSYAVSQIAGNIARTAAAEQRNWVDRLLGRQPAGLASTLSAAQERAAAHFERHSVSLHNSVRGAVGLGVAIFVANQTGLQHSFWVVLGTLSVLRSNALSTGQNVVRGLLGTTAGVVLGAGVLVGIGTNRTALWILLPIAILVAGAAPAAISFAAGQAGFTLTLVILFNIIAPAGWRVGLVRIEDIAIGCAVSLAVGLLFWPRGAAAALGIALAEAYVDSARYLAAAVEFGVRRCHAGSPAGTPAAAGSLVPPLEDSIRAAAASRRLDDTLRGYLAERGAKPVPLAEMFGLLTGVVSLRLAADAILDLWQPDDASDPGNRAAARAELLAASAMVQRWYEELAASLTGHGKVPVPLSHDQTADSRLIGAVRHDLRAEDGKATATAVRVIWTGDHLDAVRRLQSGLVEPARVATARAALTAGHGGRPWPNRWLAFT
ncbi:MAG: FUSC family protein [Actinomycetota bacterium]|nr:FUSC family protein [Actinomycetota bacterium]